MEVDIPIRSNDLSININNILLGSKQFNQQFNRLYLLRLNKLRSILINKFKVNRSNYNLSNNNNDNILSSEIKSCEYIKDITDDTNCLIIDEYEKEKELASKERTYFLSGDDKLLLEDETGRIKLIFDECEDENVSINSLITGVVCGFIGRVKEANSGEFSIKRSLFVGLPPQAQANHVNKYICLASGIGNSDYRSMQQLSNFLTSDLVLPGFSSSEISRLIMAGNSFPPLGTDKKSNYGSNSTATIDMFLSQVLPSLPIDILPGDLDPSNVTLPQIPLHSCLFPNAGSFSNFNRVSNPYSVDLNGIEISGSSGQNITDLKKFSTVGENTTVEQLERLLRYSHLAPSAPDTLPCYPSLDIDPFIIASCPHIFFAGNQPLYETKLLLGEENQKVRLISVPDFSISKTIVLVNLGSNDYECIPITFN